MVITYLQGTLNIANVFLSVVAGIVAISLFRVSHRTKHLRPWKLLIAVLVLFALEEIFGALAAFGIIPPSFITHVIPFFIMLLLIYAVELQTEYYTLSYCEYQRGEPFKAEHHNLITPGNNNMLNSKKNSSKTKIRG